MKDVEASPALRRHAEKWTLFCRQYVSAKRVLCGRIEAILRDHPDYPKPPRQCIAFSESHYSETLSQLDSMTFTPDSDIPLVPKESPTSSCCTSPNHGASASRNEERTPSKINTFLRKEYTKICESLKYKFEKIFPPKKELINTMLEDIRELEYDLKILEMQCDKLQVFYENPEALAVCLRRRTYALTQIYAETNSHFENAIDCKSSLNKKLKKYVHDRLVAGEYARAPEHRRLPSPDEACGGDKIRQSTKKSSKNVSTPQRRSGRLAQAAAGDPEDLQDQISSPKHSAKDSSDKKKLKMSETQTTFIESSPGHITDQDNEEADFLLSDSTGDASRDTIATDVYDSVEGMGFSTESEDDSEKIALSKSPKKIGTKSKAGVKKDLVEAKEVAATRSPSKTGTKSKTNAIKNLAETKVATNRSPFKIRTKSKKASAEKDIAEAKVTETGSPSKSIHDPMKTGTKPKVNYVKKPVSKSRYGYGYDRVPQLDSDEEKKGK